MATRSKAAKTAKKKPSAPKSRAMPTRPVSAAPVASAPPMAAARTTPGDKKVKNEKKEKNRKAEKKGKKPEAGKSVESGATQPKKKQVRDSFTMPAADYSLIAMLKARSLAAGIAVKKSELLRAGLVALSVMPPARLFEVIEGLPKVKTGRPEKKKK
ncbi:MAG: hypothetical protein ABIS68_02675 [Casimicrobiaceae bacterium]